MSRTDSPCGLCERFTIAGREEQAAAGKGLCTGFDNEGEPPKFVRCDDTPPCPLFNLEPIRTKLTKRKRFIEQHQAKTLEAADAAP